SQNAVARRRHRWTRGDPSIMMIIPISVAIDEDVVIYLMGIYDDVVVDDSHSPRHGLVHVMDVGDADVVNVVIVVSDVRDVGDASVADVHRLKVVSAYTVVRNVGFAVSKREPADSGAAAANPRYQRGSVAGTDA